MSKFFEDDLKKAIEKYQKQGVTKATMRGVCADLAKLIDNPEFLKGGCL